MSMSKNEDHHEITEINSVWNLGITEYNQKNIHTPKEKEVNVRKNALNELSNVGKSEELSP